MDNLEKFIQGNKKAFDTVMPSDKVWSNIVNSMPKINQPKKRYLGKKIAIAASLLLLAGFSYFAGAFSERTQSNPEWAALESLYAQKIDSKVKAVAVRTNDTQWKDDLFQLEAVMLELKQELKRNQVSTKNEIVQAMRENYEIRLQILNKILEKTEKTYKNTKPINNDNTK